MMTRGIWKHLKQTQSTRLGRIFCTLLPTSTTIKKRSYVRGANLRWMVMNHPKFDSFLQFFQNLRISLAEFRNTNPQCFVVVRIVSVSVVVSRTNCSETNDNAEVDVLVDFSVTVLFPVFLGLFFYSIGSHAIPSDSISYFCVFVHFTKKCFFTTIWYK